MASWTNNNSTYYINPAYLTFVENSGYGANLIQVSASSSCYISVFIPGVIGYSDADKNYRRWKITAYNNKFPDNDKFYIYVRLEKDGTSALMIYDKVLRGVHGGEIIEKTDEEGNITKEEGEYDENHAYYYIHIGEVSETDGSSIREITYDTGYLTSDMSQNDQGGLNEMFELDKYSTPWLIKAKQWLASFTVKGFVKLIGGLVFSKGTEGSDKVINDIKRSTDNAYEYLLNEDGSLQLDAEGNPVKNPEFVPVSDETLATSKYVEKRVNEIESDKFIRKDQNDNTEYSLGVGGDLSVDGKVVFQEKPVTEFIRYYDEEKPEYAHDAAVYSALMTDMRIEEEFENIGERFIRKDVEDTAHKHITFEEGITVQGLAKTMNLEVEELATIARAIVTTLSSSKFVDGFAGEGYQIWRDIASGDWNMTLDKLTVRKVMMIYELVIQKIRSVGGMIVVSAANGKVKSVERVGIEYKFTFEDTNTFAQNDLMRCQVFSPSGLKYYWVEVTHVDGENVYARVADFQGVTPTAGDECVLMGNTKNKLRQNMLLISATEDGQPRFDCYDGIRTKNFEGCLRTRVGCLDGITDSRFPSDLQPKGYGLYADNCFLTGVFVLSNGKDVQTQFAIMEGMIRTEISSVRSEINAKDNYLTNASFSSSLESWSYENEVRVFSTSGGLLHFNGNFYSVKDNFAGVVAKDSKNVLRIKNSFITQNNADYNIHPSFDKVIDGDLYSPRMFYISFKYMCASEGTLKVYFNDEKNDGTFEAYSPIIVEELVPQNLSFEVAEYEGKWNGTGDFYLSFTGDIYIYDLALSDNALADVEEKFNLRFEATDKKIQANLEHINKNGEKMEQYYSEFKLTAESLESSFNKKVSDQYSKITSEYSSKITQTAQELRSDYTELVEDTEASITSAYKSLISQTAREIRAEMSESLEDLEDGLVADYESQISLTARELRTKFSEDLTDLETGLTSSYKSAISQTAKEIRAELSSLEEDLDGRITENSTDISIQAGKITSLISTTETLGDEISSAQSSITQQADSIETLVSRTDKISGRVTTTETAINQHTTDIQALAKKVTVDSSGNITNISKSGLVLDSEFASMFSTQVTSQGIAKTASLSAYVLETELETLVSKIEISADQIDLSGVVTYDMLDVDLQDELDGKATSSALTTAKNQLNNSISTLNTTVSGLQTEVSKKASVDSLNSKVTELNNSIASKANKDLTNAVVSGSTLIVGGYINADLIDADAISTNSLVTKNDSSGYAITVENGYIKLSNGSYVPLQINSSNYGATILIEDDDDNSALLSHYGFYHNNSDGRYVYITDGGISLSQESFIEGFALGSIGTSISSTSYRRDFAVISSNSTLPSPSSCKGKVIFVKFSGSRTLNGKIVPRNGTSEVSSVSHSNLSAFYISNGSYWYEFLSVD